MNNFHIIKSKEADELYSKWKVIGQSVPRSEGRAKVTGKALYVDDVRLNDNLYAKLLRSPYAHAKIKRINTEKSEGIDGVKAIVTFKDMAELGLENTLIPNTPFYVLKDTVFYVGDIVAAVAAEDEAVAEEALDCIEVDYEPMPFALTPEDAAKQEAAIIHPEFGPSNKIGAETFEGSYEKIEGNIDQGLEEADVIVERYVRVPALKHMFIEQMGCVADWRADELFIWASCQSLDVRGVRTRMATFFRMPVNKIQVYGCYMGGGFGGKQHGYHRLAAITALLAKKSRRPVKIRTNIKEHFVQGNKHEVGPASYKIKLGVKKDGTITALVGEVIGGEGSFITTDLPLGLHFFGDNLYNYHTVNRQYKALPFYTNTLESGPLRGYGSQLGSFAIESVIDEAIEAIGMDPVQFKIQNGIRSGDKVCLNPGILAGGNMPDLVEKAAKIFRWKEKWRGWSNPSYIRGSKKFGVGMAIATHGTGTGTGTIQSDTAIIKICEDGSAEVSTGVVDMGSGLETAICQVAAEVLEIPYDSVRKVPVDRGNPNSFGTYDSRGLPTTVTAAYYAASDAKQKLLSNASALLGTNIEQLRIDGERRCVYDITNRGKSISFGDIVFGAGQILGAGIGAPAGPALAIYEPEKAIEPKSGLLYTERGLFTSFAEVEVDIENGQIDIINLLIGCEAGMVINPQIALGQCIGGGTFGISMLLREGYVYDQMSGAPLNCSFTDYPILSSLDINQNGMHCLIMCDPNLAPTVPFHGKGMGEGTFAATLAAINNAVYNAIGVRIREFPLKPELILKALE